MNTITSDQLLGRLRWRYATKQFDPAAKIPEADWAALEETLILTPSSFGLQPWRFVVVNDPATRERLVPVSWDQRQPADASHFVVFAVPTKFGETEIDALLARTVELRGGEISALAGYRGMMTGSLLGRTDGELRQWMIRQVYIALGNFMTSAAMLGIDTCPMEGLDPAKYDEILGLPARGLATVVACAAGYRAAGDKYAALAKVRFKAESLFTRI